MCNEVLGEPPPPPPLGPGALTSLKPDRRPSLLKHRRISLRDAESDLLLSGALTNRSNYSREFLPADPSSVSPFHRAPH